MKPTLLDAINALIENAECSVYGDETEDFKVLWLNGTQPVSNDAILAKLKELNSDYENKKYQRDRELLYPKLEEQLDLLYHDMTNGKGNKTGEWYKAVNKVKADIPKPE